MSNQSKMLLHKPGTQEPYYYGECVREWVFNCDTDVLPSWLEYTGNSGNQGVFQGFGAVNPGIKLSTGPFNANSVGIQTSFEIDTSKYTQVQWIVEGVVFNKLAYADGRLYMRMLGAAGIQHSNNGGSEEVDTNHETGRNINYSVMRYFDKPQGMGISYYPKQKLGFLLTGDPEHGGSYHAELKNVNNFVGRFGVVITSLADSNFEMTINKITLRLVTP